MSDSFSDRWSEAAAGTLSGIVDLRLHLAAVRLLRLLGKANFNPDQPRIPAGQPDGGQWTASPGTASGENAESPRLVQAERRRRYNIDLYEEEGVGHTIERHVGKSPDYLRRRIADSQSSSLFAAAGLYRAGSFPSVEAARKLVNSTLAQNFEIVEQVASGAIRGNVFVTAVFPSKTGIEAFLPESGRPGFFSPSKIASIFVRDTYGVGVTIRYDPSVAKGFPRYHRLSTKRLRSNAVETTQELRSLGALFHQDVDLYVDMKDEHAVVAYVLDNLDVTQHAALKTFLTNLLQRKLSDRQLGRLWLSTGTDIYFSRGLRQFLALVRDTIPD